MIIGIGIDAVEVERFRAMLGRRAGLEARLFTAGERSDCGGAAQRLGARFAAKEAVMKAMGVGLGAFGFHDVSVARAPSGQPSLVVVGPAAALAAERGITTWYLSLTHTDLVAEAMVVAERR